MGAFKTCPHCGANLDPGERCDCQAQGAEEKRETTERKEAKTA